MKVYFIGMGGIGMTACAGLAKALGFEVYGSEEREIYPPASNLLRELKIEPIKPDPERMLRIRPDYVVVGNAVSSTHPEVLFAKAHSLPMLSFPEFLERFLLPGRKSLVIAGTHGKTTTSAMLSFVLSTLGLRPSYLVGGLLLDFGKNFAYGEGDDVVLEGDEYPSSFFNPNPKFLHYQPRGLILTSLEYDHADVYPDLSSLKEAFLKLVKLLPQDGVLIYHQDEENLRELFQRAKPSCQNISYGEKPSANYQLLMVWGGFGKEGFESFGLAKKGEETFEIRLKIPGKHNLLNALSVLALSEALGLKREAVLEALSHFSGVKRRQEVLFSGQRVLVIDDFAHHPTAVKLTLHELKALFQPERTILIFEPRTNSSKRKVFQKEYIDSLALADIIGIKIPPNLERVPEEERIDLPYLRDRLLQIGKKAFIFERGLSLKDLEFEPSLKTLIVFMSSAYLSEEIRTLIEELKSLDA